MKRSALLTALLVGTLALAGCQAGTEAPAGTSGSSAGNDRADLSLGAPESVTAPAAGVGLAAGVGPAVEVGLAGLVETGIAAQIRPGDVIRTGDLEVVVPDVRAAADAAARLVDSLGGLLESEERSDQGPQSVAVLQLRVPPAAFDPAVTGLAALGEEQSRRLGRQDVTGQVVDLQSRLASQQASVDRVRALLSQAENLGEVVQVEAELTRRTADLESLQARLAALTTQVDLSTITLRLSAHDAPVAAAGALGFRAGLQQGWAAVVAIGHAIGVTAGTLLPFTPLLAGGIYLLWRARRPSPALPSGSSAD